MEIQAGASGTFKNLTISPETVRLVRADQTEGNIPLIPSNYYKLESSSALRSFCLAVQWENDPYGIIIPVMEVIRFYYARSTDLSLAVFNGEFPSDPDSLLNAEKSGLDIDNKDGKEMKIFKFFPRRHLSDYDGYTVGRILYSDVANRNALRISGSIRKHKMNEDLGLPESEFPFIGTTTLKVHRKRILGRTWRNLVLTIDWCSGPFPFDHLSVEWKRGGHATGEYEESDPLTLSRAGRQVSPPKDSDMTIRSDQDTTIQAGFVQYALPTGQFGAVDEKSIIKVESEDAEEPSGRKDVRLAGRNFSPQSYGTAPGSYAESSSARIDFVEDKNLGPNAAVPVSLQMFIDARHIINKTDGFQASFRVIGTPAPPRGIASFFPHSSQSHWEYLRFRAKHKRRAIIVEVEFKNCHFCVVEIERRDTENYKAYLFYSPNYARLEGEAMQLVLEYLVKNEGRLKEENFNPGIQWDFLIHTWVDAEECGEKIINKIEKISLCR